MPLQPLEHLSFSTNNLVAGAKLRDILGLASGMLELASKENLATVLDSFRALVYTKVYTKMRVKVDIVAEKHRLSVKGEVPISIRLTQNKKRKYIRIGLSLKSEYWDEIRNKPKNNCPNAEYIENIIIEKLAKYQKQILEFQSIGKEYSLQQLIESVEKPIKDITVENYLNIINELPRRKRTGYQ